MPRKRAGRSCHIPGFPDTTLGSTTQTFNPGDQLATATTSGTTTTSYGYNDADPAHQRTPATGSATSSAVERLTSSRRSSQARRLSLPARART